MKITEAKSNNGNNTNSATANKCEYYIKVGDEQFNEDTNVTERILMPGLINLQATKKNVISGEGEAQDLYCAGNDLYDAVMELCESLEPGEAREVNLKVFVCRKRTSQEEKHTKRTFNLTAKK